MSIERPAIVNAHGIVKALVDYQAEYDRMVQENRTLRRRVAELEEATGADLSGAIARMNDVITAQIEAVGASSGIAKAADIRRRQVAKYSPEHDAEHGPVVLARAAAALLLNDIGLWPFADFSGFHLHHYNQVHGEPTDTFAHAAALAAAAYDAQRAGGKE